MNSDMWVRNAIALNAGVLVVATPIFLSIGDMFSVGSIRRYERQAALRKFTLYVASAVCAGYALYSVY